MQSNSIHFRQHQPPVTSKSLLSHLRKSNPELYKLVLKLPAENKQLRTKYERLSTPIHRKVFIQRVKREKKAIQKKFDIIRQSIDSKNSNNRITNEQIIKECNSLKIKNIARKYSDYKIKQNIDTMQQKLKMQKMHRCMSQSWAINKIHRPKSCVYKKTKQQKTEVEDDILTQIKNLQKNQERLNTQNYQSQFQKPTENLCINTIQDATDYGRAKLLISESYKSLKKFKGTSKVLTANRKISAHRTDGFHSYLYSLQNYNPFEEKNCFCEIRKKRI